jgi:WD40 repeat protein
VKRPTITVLVALAATLLAGCSGAGPTLSEGAQPIPTTDCLVFSPDGAKLAATFNSTVKVFDTTSGSVLQTFTASNVVPTLAWSPDGSLLAGGTHGKIVLVWDVAGGQVRHTLAGPKAPVNAVAWSPDGKLLVVAAGDPNMYADKRGNVRSEVRMLDPVAGQELGVLDNPGDTIMGVAFSPDGTRFVTVGGVDGKIRLWDTAARKPAGPAAVNSQGAGVSGVAFSPDGRTLATGGLDKALTLWDPTTLKEKARFEGHADRVNAVAFTPLGPVSASDDGSVRVWDVEAKIPRTVLRDKGPRVHAVAATRDGKTVAAGGAGGVVRVWDLSSPGAPRLELK